MDRKDPSELIEEIRVRICLISIIALFTSCNNMPPPEELLVGKYLLQSDHNDELIMNADHSFEHNFISESVHMKENGQWHFSKSKKKYIEFKGNTKPFVLGMVGERESEVIVKSSDTLIQGGRDNVDWYTKSHQTKK